MKRLGLLALLAAAAAPASAHGGSHERAIWTFDLWVTGPLALLALCYAVGFFRLRARSDRGRAQLRWQGLIFAAGWLSLAGAAVSPLHAAGEHSFTMHMIEHEIIMLLAALLLVAARPGAVLLWGLPVFARRPLASVPHFSAARASWRFLTDPVVATVIQAAAMWLWHIPSLFDRALEQEGWHIAQHLSFLLSALLFWWAMLHSRQGRNGYGVSGACLFVTSLVGGALGALMTFSGSPWYRAYAQMGMAPFGLTPVEDQQLAGLIMWIPGGLVHAGAALYFLYKWLQASEARHAVPAN